MPIIYIPLYLPDLDYRLLTWLDKHHGKSEFGFKIIDELNINPIILEKSFRRLSSQGLLLLTIEKGVIIEVALTIKSQRLLAEHILGDIMKREIDG